MKLRPHRILIAAACTFACVSLKAETYTWVPTAASTTDWNTPVNWSPSTGFPNAAGDIANLNTDITGNQTIRLRQNILVGTLNVGDINATTTSFAFTVGNAGTETFSLTFDSGVVGTAAQINLSASATTTNTFSAPIILNSDLAINLGTGLQTLSTSATGSITTGIRNISITGGAGGATNQFNLTGDIAGSGTITNSSNSPMVMSGAKSFTGTFVLNKGIGGSNTGSLTLTTGSVINAAEIVINGFLSAGIVQNGALLHSGNGSAQATNPGQRLTQNRITLNGGSLNAAGQTLSGPALNTEIADTVATVDLNSAYSLINVGAGVSQSGTRLNITTMERSPGATALVRSGTLGGTARILVGNAAGFLRGGGGAEASTTMSIIPWMVAANTNGSAGNSSTFATYTATGIRALVDAEYALLITAGADQNVRTGTFITAPGPETTVNSLRMSIGSVANIGSGKTLIIASGALSFENGNSGIGINGDAAAGTLAFGSAEGVIWSNSSNTNTIGSVINGTGGLTKAGTGTLILTGTNTYSGLTYVGGGTLQVGTGFGEGPRLGLASDVAVANGATLSLFTSTAIDDGATLKLEQFGLFNGKVNVNFGVDETIGSLFFNNSFAPAGTYGSTLSDATFKSDTYFSGTGVLTVVPETGSAAMLLGAVVTLLGLRRRRA